MELKILLLKPPMDTRNKSFNQYQFYDLCSSIALYVALNVPDSIYLLASFGQLPL